MADAEIDICNLALALIGDWEIADFDEGSQEARICKKFYHPTRRSTLLMHDWNCASRAVGIPLIADYTREPNRQRWCFSYMVPTDCLTVREILRYSDQLPPIPFEVTNEGNYLVLNTDVVDPVIRYTRDIGETAQFSEPFRQAFFHRLAATIAIPLTQKGQLADYVAQRAQTALLSAMAADSNEGVKSQRKNADWIRRRGGLPNNHDWLCKSPLYVNRLS